MSKAEKKAAYSYERKETADWSNAFLAKIVGELVFVSFNHTRDEKKNKKKRREINMSELENQAASW